jgi:hypothetical protein
VTVTDGRCVRGVRVSAELRCAWDRAAEEGITSCDACGNIVERVNLTR